jgi:uncharacterized membrane protein
MFWLLSPRLIRFLHGIGSLLLFGFMVWFFVCRRPSPDYNELLTTLISAQVTIVTVMFSAVLVALQLASAQFSPRITRHFFRYNPTNQSAFYLFLFGIAYCAAVKFTYQKDLGAFTYPWMPVAGTVYAFFVMSFVLPRFVFHIADSINVASITHAIATRTLEEIEVLYGSQHWQPGDLETQKRPLLPTHSLPVQSHTMGFLDQIYLKKLEQLAKKWPNYQFYVQPIVGTFISPGEDLVLVGGLPEAAALPAGLAQQAHDCFLIRPFRSYEHDVSFGVRQLSDIAVKAISPAVNDPTTAINCLHYIGAIVWRHALVQHPSVLVRTATPNLFLKDFTFDSLVDLAFDQIYQWGRQDPVVVCQVLATIADIGRCIHNPHCLEVLRKQVAHFEIKPEHYELAEHRERVTRHLAECQMSLSK